MYATSQTAVGGTRRQVGTAAWSEEEMERLALQADVLHTRPTRWLFDRAGLGKDMCVLDVG